MKLEGLALVTGLAGGIGVAGLHLALLGRLGGQHGAAAPDVGAQVDVPAEGARRGEVGDGRLRSREDDQRGSEERHADHFGLPALVAIFLSSSWPPAVPVSFSTAVCPNSSGKSFNCRHSS